MTTMNEYLLRHYRGMRSFAGRLAGSSRADDLVQSACVMALSSAIKPSEIVEPGAFLNHCVRMSFYRMLKKTIAPEKLTDSMECVKFVETVSGGQEAALELSDVMEVIEGMPPARGEILMLHACGFTATEIAQMRGRTKQSVSQQLGKARRDLARAACSE